MSAAIVVREFPSKRNQVRLLRGEEGLFVEKYFSSPEAAAKEARVYRLLMGSGVKTASLLEAEGRRLYLSYLPGEDYLSLLERQEAGIYSEGEGCLLLPWERLLDYLAAFHRATGMVQRDMNLRNFLWLGREAAGLDFEDCHPGSLSQSFAILDAYVRTYDPPGTEIKKRVGAYIEERAVKWGLCDAQTFAALLSTEEEVITLRRKRRVGDSLRLQGRKSTVGGGDSKEL